MGATVHDLDAGRVAPASAGARARCRRRHGCVVSARACRLVTLLAGRREWSALRVAERRAVDRDGVALVAEAREERVDERLVPDVVPFVVLQVRCDNGRLPAVGWNHFRSRTVASGTPSKQSCRRVYPPRLRTAPRSGASGEDASPKGGSRPTTPHPHNATTLTSRRRHATILPLMALFRTLANESSYATAVLAGGGPLLPSRGGAILASAEAVNIPASRQCRPAAASSRKSPGSRRRRVKSGVTHQRRRDAVTARACSRQAAKCAVFSRAPS